METIFSILHESRDRMQHAEAVVMHQHPPVGQHHVGKMKEEVNREASSSNSMDPTAISQTPMPAGPIDSSAGQQLLPRAKAVLEAVKCVFDDLPKAIANQSADAAARHRRDSTRTSTVSSTPAALQSSSGTTPGTPLGPNPGGCGS